MLITDSPTDPAPRLERLRPGSLVYYPAWQHHTIRNPGTSPVAYLMFKWHAASSGSKTPLTVAVHHFGGFYFDLDVYLARSLEPLRQHRCVFPFEELTINSYLLSHNVDWEIGNYAFASAPGVTAITASTAPASEVAS